MTTYANALPNNWRLCKIGGPKSDTAGDGIVGAVQVEYTGIGAANPDHLGNIIGEGEVGDVASVEVQELPSGRRLVGLKGVVGGGVDRPLAAGVGRGSAVARRREHLPGGKSSQRVSELSTWTRKTYSGVRAATNGSSRAAAATI